MFSGKPKENIQIASKVSTFQNVANSANQTTTSPSILTSNIVSKKSPANDQSLTKEKKAEGGVLSAAPKSTVQGKEIVRTSDQYLIKCDLNFEPIIKHLKEKKQLDNGITEKIFNNFGFLFSSIQPKQKSELEEIAQFNNQEPDIKRILLYFIGRLIDRHCKKFEFVSELGAKRLIKWYILSKHDQLIDQKNGKLSQQIKQRIKGAVRFDKDQKPDGVNEEEDIFKSFLASIQQKQNQFFHFVNQTLQLLNQKSEYDHIDSIKIAENIWLALKRLLTCSTPYQMTNYINTIISSLLSVYERDYRLYLRKKHKSYFTASNIEQQILPFFIEQPFPISLQMGINFNDIESFILQLVLKYPLTISDWKGIQNLIDYQNKLTLFRYLQLIYLEYKAIEDTEELQQYYQYLQPLKHSAWLIYIDQLLKIRSAKSNQHPQFQKFLLNSLYNYSNCNDWKNYDNIVNFLQELGSKALRQRDAKSLNNFSKVITVFCLQSQVSYKVHFNNFMLFIFNSNLKQALLNFQLHLISDKKSNIEQNEHIYEYLFRLLILNSHEFEQEGQAQLVKQKFKKTKNFYQKLFVMYLIKGGKHVDICLEAMNSIFLSLQNTHFLINMLSDLANCYEDDGENALKQLVRHIISQTYSWKAVAKHLLILLSILNDIKDQKDKRIKSVWFQQINSVFKELSIKKQPCYISEYALMLQESFAWFKDNQKLINSAQHYFNYRFISQYFNYCFSFEINDQKPRNKLALKGKVEHLQLGLKLINTICKIYFDKQNITSLLPEQIKDLLEMNSQNNTCQLISGDRGCSLLTSLIILLFTDRRFTKSNLSKQIYLACIQLSRINKKYNELVVWNINSRDGFFSKQLYILKQDLCSFINYHPSYLGLQLINELYPQCKQQKKNLLNKLASQGKQYGIQDSPIVIRFVHYTLKQISLQSLSNERERWNEASAHLQKIIKILEQHKNNPHFQNQIAEVLDHIYLIMIELQSSNHQLYTQFSIKCHRILFNRINLEFEANQNYFLAIKYFLTCRAFLQNQHFKIIEKEKNIATSIQHFISQLIQTKHNDSNISLIIAYALSMLIQLSRQNQIPNLKNQFQKMGNIRRKINSETNSEVNLSENDIVVNLLLESFSHYECDFDQMITSNDFWVLSLNTTKPNKQTFSEVVGQITEWYSCHPVFFVSGCNYIKRGLSSNIRFIEVPNFYEKMKILLTKSISGYRSYHAIWVIEIFAEVIDNQKLYNNQSKKIIQLIDIEIFHNRIAHLLHKLHWSVGLELDEKIQWMGSAYFFEDRKEISLAQKSELQAYLNLLCMLMLNQFETGNKYQGNIYKDFQPRVCKSFLKLLPLLKCLFMPKFQKFSNYTTIEEKLSKFDFTFQQNLKSSGLNQKIEEQSRNLFNGKYDGLSYLHFVLDVQILASFDTILCYIAVEHKQLLKQDENGEHLMEMFQMIVQSTINLCKHKNSLEGLIKMFVKEVCNNSVQFSSHFLFTNCSRMRSRIEAGWDQVIDQLRNIIANLYYIGEKATGEGMRNENKLKKVYQNISKQIIKFEKQLNLEQQFAGKLKKDKSSHTTNRSKTIRQVY